MKLDTMILLVGGVFLVIALTGWVLALKEEARQTVIDQIEEQNREAGDAAEEVSRALRACRDAGGLWDFAASECVGAP